MIGFALALLLAPGPVSIAARMDQEGGQREIIATVTANGKPAAGVGVGFELARTFGSLPLGEDTTLEDGTAAAPFPKGLGTDADGGWTVKVVLRSPEPFQGQEATVRIPATAAELPVRPAPARELWARHAPWSLLAAVGALMASAWAAYGFAAYQLFRIGQGGQDD